MVSRRQHRLQSSLDLFVEACRLWGKTFEMDDLLLQVDEMESELESVSMAECSEELVAQVETATVHLVNSMDNLIKAMGGSGFCYGQYKH